MRCVDVFVQDVNECKAIWALYPEQNLRHDSAFFRHSWGFRNQERFKHNLRWIALGLTLLLTLSYLRYVCILYDIPQDSHQLSICESGSSGYAVRDLYYPSHFPQAHFHLSRWDGRYRFVQIGDGWRLGVDCWNFLGCHFDCNCR